MKKPWLTLGGLAAAALLFSACGGGPDKSAFNNAAPEVKQVWKVAVAADHASDYLAANTNYASLLSQSISADQLVAVQAALQGLNERMRAAADKGDAVAQKAVEELKKLQGTQATPGRPGPR